MLLVGSVIWKESQIKIQIPWGKILLAQAASEPNICGQGLNYI